jgi:superfamily II DNA or RNA helicase
MKIMTQPKIDTLRWQKYEKYAVNYHHDITNHTTYHWKNIPEQMLEDSGYLTDYNRVRKQRQLAKLGEIMDYGLDGLAHDSNTNTYFGLQMKCYQKGYVTANDVGSFTSVVNYRLCKKNPISKSYLYYTSQLQVDLADDLTDSNIIPVRLMMDDDTFVKTEATINNNIINTNNLWTHQKDAVEALDKAYQKVITQKTSEKDESHDSSDDEEETLPNLQLVNCPCGTGKTKICEEHLVHIQPDMIIAIAPLKMHVQQLMARLKPHLENNYNYNFILVDSDDGGTTNIRRISQLIKFATKNKRKVCICSTFVSAENILAQPLLASSLKKSCIVVDEVHNVITNVTLKNFINSFDYGLLLTATPPSMLLNDLNCKLTYQYPVRKAIQDIIICDYEIIIPVPYGPNDIPMELKQFETNNLLMKAVFVVNAMLKCGNRRCITYFTKVSDCKEFEKMVKAVCESYHFIDVWTDSITGDDSQIRREDLLKQFQAEDDSSDKKLYILNSVRILDEGVDIIKCDCEFISNLLDTSSDIRTVQRLMRGCRIDPDNKNKINRLLLWCDSDMTILKSALSLLKDNDDVLFEQKIKMMTLNYDNQRNKETVKDVHVREQVLQEFVKVDCTEWSHYVNVQTLINNIQKVKDYIDIHKKRPSKSSRDPVIKQLGYWVTTAHGIYNKKCSWAHNAVMYDIYGAFIEDETYYKFFHNKTPHIHIEELKEFLAKHNKRPTALTEDETEKNLANWLTSFLSAYRQKKLNNHDDYLAFKSVICDERYEELFFTTEERIDNLIDKSTQFIRENNKRPWKKSKNENEKKMGIRLSCALQDYKNGTRWATNNKLRLKFKEFIDRHIKFFTIEENRVENVLERIKELKEFFDKYDRVPNLSDAEIHLRWWLTGARRKYKDKKEWAVKKELYEQFDTLVKSYPQFFVSQESKRNERIANLIVTLKSFFDQHRKRPSSIGSEQKLLIALSNATKNYCSRTQWAKDDVLYKKFDELVRDPRYTKYFNL